MKQSTVLASLAAGFAAAAHHDHAHAHNHARRGADGVVTSWEITTEWTYVTVTGPAGPAQTPDSGNQGAPAGNQGAPNASAPSSVQAAPLSSAAADDVSAAAVTAAPASSSMDANAIQMSINSAQKASDLAHQSSMQWLQAHPSGGSAPAQSQATSTAAVASSTVAVASSQVSSSAAAPPAQSSGSSTTPSSGAGMKGIGTYYAGSGAYGSCGSALSDNDHGVALAENIMSSTNKKLCGASITIVSGGQSWPAKVVDSCGACTTDPNGHIDILQGYAHTIDPNIDVAGHADLTWSFDDASMASIWKGAAGA